MKALRNRLAAAAIAASSIFFGVNAAHAVNITWDGVGNTGSDPFGHTWLVNQFGWGIPGPGDGVIPWAGPDWISDFHITFDGLEISQLSFETEFVTDEDGNGVVETDWNAMFMGTDTVWFVAPPGVRLDPGEQFFVNVGFTTPATVVNFTAEYTMDQLPEPGALMLFGLGLVGLGLAARRRAG